MIQRIQSLFLLSAVILQIVFIFTPLAHFILNSSEIIEFRYNGFISVANSAKTTLVSTTAILILSWVIAILSFATIFLYKKRILQMRLTIYSLLFSLGLMGLLAFYFIQFKSANAVLTSGLTPSIVIPVANSILFFLAFRGIRKDELLVKAYDRLR